MSNSNQIPLKPTCIYQNYFLSLFVKPANILHSNLLVIVDSFDKHVIQLLQMAVIY